MSEWIETSTKSRIAKSAKIYGSDKILISGLTTIHERVELHGDVPVDENQKSTIQVGKCCTLGEGSIFTPVEDNDGVYSMAIGGYCIVGKNTVVKSKSIGNRVLIEEDCTLGDLSVIHECCFIRRGTVIPAKAVVPPFTEVSGTPGLDFEMRDLHNSYKRLIELEAKQLQILG